MTHSRQGGRGGVPRLLLLAAAIGTAATSVTSHAYTDEEIDSRFNALQQQVAATPAPAPMAIPAEESRFKVSGYFSFTGTDQPGGVYATNSSDNTDFETLSRAAVQLEFRIDEDTRFVTQLLSRGEDG